MITEEFKEFINMTYTPLLENLLGCINKVFAEDNYEVIRLCWKGRIEKFGEILKYLAEIDNENMFIIWIDKLDNALKELSFAEHNNKDLTGELLKLQKQVQQTLGINDCIENTLRRLIQTTYLRHLEKAENACGNNKKIKKELQACIRCLINMKTEVNLDYLYSHLKVICNNFKASSNESEMNIENIIAAKESIKQIITTELASSLIIEKLAADELKEDNESSAQSMEVLPNILNPRI